MNNQLANGFGAMFFNMNDPTVAQIPKDEHGFHKGTFKVTVTWIPE